MWGKRIENEFQAAVIESRQEKIEKEISRCLSASHQYFFTVHQI